MSSFELFELFSEKLTECEYILFSWSGGGDNFHGFKFIHAKVNGSITFTCPPEVDDVLMESLNNSLVFEDLSLSVYCTDDGYSEGVLLIALEALSEDLANDSVVNIYQDAGFKGIYVVGLNHEELSGSMEA